MATQLQPTDDLTETVTESVLRVHVYLTETVTDQWVDTLLRVGVATPFDYCECLYVRIADWLELVFHLFA